MALSALLTAPADAQGRYYRYDNSNWGYSAPAQSYAPRIAPRRSQQAATTGSVKKPEAKVEPGFGEMPKGPLQIIVSIGSQKVTLYSNGTRVAQGPVSTGVPGHPTPLGVFSVIEKDRHHHSNIYSGAPMPFMQRITWSGVALHEGVLPGHPASHGCIRMSHDFAQKLWPVTKLGVRVIVARPELAPVDFGHPKLFVPKQKPAGPQVAMDDEAITLVQVAQAMQDGATVVDVTPIPGDVAPAKAIEMTEGQTTEGLVELGINAPAAAAVEPSEELIELGIKTTQAPPAPAAPQPSEDGIKATQAAPQAPAADPGQADDTVKATGTIAPRPAELTAPQPPSDLRRSVEAPEPPPPAPAAPAGSEPDKPVPAVTDPPKPIAPRIKNADQPQKRYGQVAVFVSRKEKKIFVRQGFSPIFDMPIVIDEMDRPLGTHVFTAMGFTANGAGMRWNLISVPSEPATAAPEPVYTRGKKPAVQAPKPPVVHKTPSTAAEALDRIQFPQAALERIGELLIPGSSLVVSDEGLGRETGRGTEFIVLTR